MLTIKRDLGRRRQAIENMILELKWRSFFERTYGSWQQWRPRRWWQRRALPIQNTTLLQSHHEHHLVTLSLFSQISMVLVVRPIQHQRRDDDQSLARINVAAAYTLWGTIISSLETDWACGDLLVGPLLGLRMTITTMTRRRRAWSSESTSGTFGCSVLSGTPSVLDKDRVLNFISNIHCNPRIPCWLSPQQL
jgi:hypothetical protein